MAAALAVAVTACDGTGSDREAASGESVADEDAQAGDWLDLGETHTRVCVPAPEDDDTVIGDTMVEHQGDEPVTITDVSLVGARDLALVEAQLVELSSDESLVGIRYATDEDSLPAGWEDRVEAEGADLEPGEARNLVLVVDDDAEDTAFAESARITYEDSDGNRYEQETLSSILVGQRPCEDVLAEPDPEGDDPDR